MPVMRQASLMRTVMGRAMDRSSWLLLLLGKGGCFTAVGPPQLLLDQLYKAEIARPPQARGVVVERRLVRDQCQLMPHEQPEHFGQRIDLSLKPLGCAVLPVEPGLRRTRARGKRAQLC